MVFVRWRITARSRTWDTLVFLLHLGQQASGKPEYQGSFGDGDYSDSRSTSRILSLCSA
jgi:hypothetical protein